MLLKNKPKWFKTKINESVKQKVIDYMLNDGEPIELELEASDEVEKLSVEYVVSYLDGVNVAVHKYIHLSEIKHKTDILDKSGKSPFCKTMYNIVNFNFLIFFKIISDSEGFVKYNSKTKELSAIYDIIYLLLEILTSPLMIRTRSNVGKFATNDKSWVGMLNLKNILNKYDRYTTPGDENDIDYHSFIIDNILLDDAENVIEIGEDIFIRRCKPFTDPDEDFQQNTDLVEECNHILDIVYKTNIRNNKVLYETICDYIKNYYGKYGILKYTDSNGNEVKKTNLVKVSLNNTNCFIEQVTKIGEIILVTYCYDKETFNKLRCLSEMSREMDFDDIFDTLRSYNIYLHTVFTSKERFDNVNNDGLHKAIGTDYVVGIPVHVCNVTRIPYDVMRR